MQLGRIAVAMSGISLLLSGLVLGQKARPSRFAGYEQPAVTSVMDRLLLEANLQLIRERSQRDGVYPARLFYDQEKRKIRAIVLADVRTLETETLDRVRSSLSGEAVGAWLQASLMIPELGPFDKDFEVEFRGFRKQGDTWNAVILGDWRESKLTLKETVLH